MASWSAPVSFLLFALVLFVFTFVFVLVLVEVVVFVVFALRIFRFKLDRIHAGDGQRSSALIARQHVTFVQFFFFHVDGGVTFRATHHNFSSSRLNDKDTGNRHHTPEWIMRAGELFHRANAGYNWPVLQGIG